jgi:hypothetical protein
MTIKVNSIKSLNTASIWARGWALDNLNVKGLNLCLPPLDLLMVFQTQACAYPHENDQWGVVLQMNAYSERQQSRFGKLRLLWREFEHGDDGMSTDQVSHRRILYKDDNCSEAMEFNLAQAIARLNQIETTLLNIGKTIPRQDSNHYSLHPDWSPY